MVEWIRANKPAKLEGLWKAVLPEGGTAPPAEFAADLFWLLHQGHILLFTDDTLVVQEVREPHSADPDTEPKTAKRKRNPKNPNPPAKPRTVRHPPAEIAAADSPAETSEVTVRLPPSRSRKSPPNCRNP